MLVDQWVEKCRELLPCTLTVYDCRQLENVSSVENVHMVTEILSQVLSGTYCHLHLPSLRRSFVQQAFGERERKGPLYMTSYLMFTCRPFSLNTSMHNTSSSYMDSALITTSSLYYSNNGQSDLNSVNRASYMTIKSSGIRTERPNFSLRQLPSITLLVMSLVM